MAQNSGSHGKRSTRALVPISAVVDKALLTQEKFEGVVALVVGQEVTREHPQQTAGTVPQLFKPEYLVAPLPSFAFTNSMEARRREPEAYLLQLVRRAGDYAKVPNSDGIRGYFVAVEGAHLEGLRFNPPVNVWEEFRPDIAWAIRRIIVDGGISMALKLLRYDSAWEVNAPRQMDLVNRVLQMFGVSISRVSPPELHQFVDSYADKCRAAIGMARMQNDHVRAGEIAAKYGNVTAALGDPKPLVALPTRGRIDWGRIQNTHSQRF